MRKSTITKSYHKRQEIVNRLASGWLEMLKNNGAEPDINMRELARRSRIHYRTVRRHCEVGFVESNVRFICADFKAVTHRYASSPGIMAIHLMAAFHNYSTWFSIEEARHSILLWEQLAKDLHDPLTANWPPRSISIHKALYTALFLRLSELERQYRYSSYEEETQRNLEMRLKMILELSAEGRLSALMCL